MRVSAGCEWIAWRAQTEKEHNYPSTGKWYPVIGHATPKLRHGRHTASNQPLISSYVIHFQTVLFVATGTLNCVQL